MIDEKTTEISVLLELRARVKIIRTEEREKKKKLNAYSNLQEILRIDCYIGAFDEVIREIDAMIKERRG